MVDVVAIGVCPAALEVRALSLESSVIPVLLEGALIAYAHDEDDASDQSISAATTTDDDGARSRSFPDLWLAGRKCTDAMKGIRREAEVPRDFIGKDLHVVTGSADA